MMIKSFRIRIVLPEKINSKFELPEQLKSSVQVLGNFQCELGTFVCSRETNTTKRRQRINANPLFPVLLPKGEFPASKHVGMFLRVSTSKRCTNVRYQMSMIHPEDSNLTKSFGGLIESFDENGRAESGTWEIIEWSDLLNGGYVDQKRDVEIRVELKDVEEAKIEENDDDDDFGSDDSDDSDDDLEEDFRALQQHRSLKRKLDNTPENEDDDDDTVEDLKMSGFGGNNEDDEDFIVDDIENEEDDDYYQPRVYTPCVDNGVNLSGLTNQGATCYLNSFLQVVYHTPHMRYAIFQFEPSDAMSKAIQSVFFRMLRTTGPISTKSLTSAFGWDAIQVFMQQDVQEFSRVLFDKLEEKMKGTYEFEIFQSTELLTVLTKTQTPTQVRMWRV